MKTNSPNSKYTKLFIFTLISTLVLLPVTAKAQVTPNENSIKPKPDPEIRLLDKQEAQEEKKAEIEARKEEKAETRCEKITALVRAKIAKYRDNRVLYVGKFSVLSERISALISRIKAEYPDLDLSKLEADLVTLNEKIAALNDLHEELISTVEDVKTAECGTGKPIFADALKEGRAALQDIRDAVLDIQKFYLEVIKPDMIDLRQEYKEKLKETEEETSEESSEESTDDEDSTETEAEEEEDTDTGDTEIEEDTSDTETEAEETQE